MIDYANVKVNITEGQKQKLKSAYKKSCQVSIRLTRKDLNGNDVLAVTPSQAKKIAKAYEKGTGVKIKMSVKQLKHNAKIEGGFLGMLAGLAARALPMLARSVLPTLAQGALSGLASSGVQKAMGSGLYLKKGGCVCRAETDGEGLYLSPYKGEGLKSFGDGLYLKQGGEIYDGKGLISQIPIIGDLFKALF